MIINILMWLLKVKYKKKRIRTFIIHNSVMFQTQQEKCCIFFLIIEGIIINSD